MATLSALQLSSIRTFSEEDIPQVADLHRRVFRLADSLSPELLQSYQRYFSEVFFNNPCPERTNQCLVYQERSGRITGFLAVMPFRMRFCGEALQAVITSQFVVDEDSRGCAGLKLLGSVLAGPQDITLADESNANSRKVWHGLGGTTSHLYSLQWIYPLRLCQSAFWLARKERFLSRILFVLRPVSQIVDGVARQLGKFPRVRASRLIAEQLDCESLAICLSEAGCRQTLRPEHSIRSLRWLLQRAGQLHRNGRLQKVLLKTSKKEIVGWYIYYANREGLSDVIQLHAKSNYSHDVLDHLIFHAREQGAMALTGRMEPSMMQAFSDRHCVFHCGPQWVLVHSRRPELVNAFNSGNAGFSRLDGEWCLHLQ
jgi:hypothetical protein